MPVVRISIPLYIPGWLHQWLRGVKRSLVSFSAAPAPVNIHGERNVEWSFISAEMPAGPGEAIEFGCEQGYMSLLAAQKGFHVLANDLQRQFFLWQHPNVDFREGDFLKLDLPRNHFDLAINCSSVEHVGVAGRYGITVEQNNGDIEVMAHLARVLKPGGLLLMTSPCGRDAVMAPWCRVYGAERLPKLIAPYHLEKESYWIKNRENQWVACSKENALDFVPRYDPNNAHGCAYALGCFVLRKPC